MPDAGKSPLLQRDSTALVVVDIQEKFAPPILEAGRWQSLLKNVIILARAAQILDLPVIVTEQYPQGLGKTAPELREVLEGRPRVEKVHFGAHHADAFRDELAASKATQVLLTGIEAHICVLQTGLGLLAAGFDVHVAADAVCSRAASNIDVALNLLAASGATITSTETAVFALLEKSGTPEFKAISPLLK